MEVNRPELLAYIDEALPADRMAAVEDKVRRFPEWREALAQLLSGSDHGEHSVATVWRQNRLTCASREKLGSYILKSLPPDEEDYIRFHLQVIGCRYCLANLADAESALVEQVDAEAQARDRRRRMFQTSVGYLPKRSGT